jgi:hypothetical protein
MTRPFFFIIIIVKELISYDDSEEIAALVALSKYEHDYGSLELVFSQVAVSLHRVGHEVVVFYHHSSFLYGPSNQANRCEYLQERKR